MASNRVSGSSSEVGVAGILSHATTPRGAAKRQVPGEFVLGETLAISDSLDWWTLLGDSRIGQPVSHYDSPSRNFQAGDMTHERGGGATAGGAARDAAQRGNDVVMYGRDREEFEKSIPPALYAELKAIGVKFEAYPEDIRASVRMPDGRILLGNDRVVDGIAVASGQEYTPPAGFAEKTGQATGIEVRGAMMGKIPPRQLADPANGHPEPGAIGDVLIDSYKAQKGRTGDASGHSSATEAAIFHHEKYIEANER